MDKVRAIMDRYADRLTAKLGAGFLNLRTGESYCVNGDIAFPAASTFKVPLLIELFTQAVEGKLDLDETITIREQDKSIGSGVLAYFTPGSTLTLRTCATLMMIISDNTATDIIWRRLGLDRINRRIEAMGLKNTKCDLTCDALVRITYGIPLDIGYREAEAALGGETTLDERLYIDMAGPNDISSPDDMITMFSAIYRKEVATPAACEEMIRIMEQCQTNNRIPYYIPHSGPLAARIAHKTGSLSFVVNDSGIIMTKDNAFVLSLFLNGFDATQEEKDRNVNARLYEQTLAELARDVFMAVHEQA
ncbi:class A beta-lactamase-related serine hydrolase [Eubacteriales bacterium OttesenSCG-928-A19]|nr:class A beta-lactamase-related serine hydrolase [Eubacteriales bacterium OttesenSCG-928-A19]